MGEPHDDIFTLNQHPRESGDEQEQRRINADGVVSVKTDPEPLRSPLDRSPFGPPPQNHPQDDKQAENEACARSTTKDAAPTHSQRRPSRSMARPVVVPRGPEVSSRAPPN